MVYVLKHCNREFGVSKRFMQHRATSRNVCFLTRNEQVSGSSPLVGSPFLSTYLHAAVADSNLDSNRGDIRRYLANYEGLWVGGKSPYLRALCT
jgi:hypothetical protein